MPDPKIRSDRFITENIGDLVIDTSGADGTLLDVEQKPSPDDIHIFLENEEDKKKK